MNNHISLNIRMKIIGIGLANKALKSAIFLLKLKTNYLVFGGITFKKSIGYLYLNVCLIIELSKYHFLINIFNIKRLLT